MSVEKYLAQHAEPEAKLARGLEAGPWDTACVVPARGEAADHCVRTTADLAERVLTVVVVNGDEQDDRAIHRANALLIQELHRRDDPDVVVVDRATSGRELPPKRGVGLARKIGSDLALALWHAGRLGSDWLHTTDADATLPVEHHSRTTQQPDEVVATVAPYVHVAAGDSSVAQATALYELSLRYYVLGLSHARSPFAYHTVGSTISVRFGAYAAVRGFPARPAAEDFYLLNKIAKVGSVRSLDGPPVEIRARRSRRAPFGTGPAVEALLESGAELRVYDPRCFDGLAAVSTAMHDGTLGATALSPPVLRAIEQRELVASISRLRERYAGDQLTQRIREWFDAFETLKLVHALTEAWPKVPWSVACERADFLPSDLAGRSVEAQRAALIDLERRQPRRLRPRAW